MNMSMKSCRALTSWEKRLLQRLLSWSFPGRDALVAQVEQAVVSPMREDGTPLDENGSFYFKTSSPESAFTKYPVPTEGEAQDVDGVTIHYLLHVVEGKIDRLEIYKDDGSEVRRQAEPEELTVDGPPYAG